MNKKRGNTGRLLIGDLLLDRGRRQISRGDNVVELPKLSYRLLLELAEAAPNMLTHDELAERVWRGRVVSPETVTQRIKLVRQALGDDALAPQYIGLVRGVGYRLLVEVRVLPADESNVARNLVSELGRRRVLQAALVYAAVAWSITEVFSFLFDALPVFPEWSKALAAIIFVVGFPVAMFLAWRFDIGPGGIRRTHAASTKGRVTIGAATLLLVGATTGLFYLIYPKVVEQTGPRAALPQLERAGNAIAVMPFVNASNNSDDLYISEGLGDELRDQLGRVEGLQVAARMSSIQFRNVGIDATVISSSLGVARLIEGTLRRQGKQLHITVQIIDGATGFQEWNRSYSRDFGDLLTTQQEIAADVVNVILPEVIRDAASIQTASTVASAYELMLIARHYFQQVRENRIVDLELMGKVINLYGQAAAADPASALAQSRLGEALLYIGDLEGAEEPIFKALTIDPELSEVQYLLGLYYWRKYQSGAGQAYERAVALNADNVEALSALGIWHWSQGDTISAEPYYRRAVDLDPMSMSRYADIGNFYGVSGEREKALAIAEQIADRFRSARAYIEIARIHELVGNLDLAIAWALRARNLQPDYRDATWMLASMYARIHDFEAVEFFESELSFATLYYARRYEELIEFSENHVLEFPNDLAVWLGLMKAYVATGRYQQAIYVARSQGLPGNSFVDSRRTTELEATVSLADALREDGQLERAREIGDWLAGYYRRALGKGTEKAWWSNLYFACSLSIIDEDEEALGVLERIVELPGHAWYPVVKDQPCFRKFVDNPRYQAVVAHFEEQKRIMRDRLPDTLARFQMDSISSE